MAIFYRYDPAKPWTVVPGNATWNCTYYPVGEVLYKVLPPCSGVCDLQPPLTSLPTSAYYATATTESLPGKTIRIKRQTANGLQNWYTSNNGYWVEWRHGCGCPAYPGDNQAPSTRVRVYPNLQGNFSGQETVGLISVYLYEVLNSPIYRFEIFKNGSLFYRYDHPFKCPDVFVGDCPPETACECDCQPGFKCCYDVNGNPIYLAQI